MENFADPPPLHIFLFFRQSPPIFIWDSLPYIYFLPSPSPCMFLFGDPHTFYWGGEHPPHIFFFLRIPPHLYLFLVPPLWISNWIAPYMHVVCACIISLPCQWARLQGPPVFQACCTASGTHEYCRLQCIMHTCTISSLLWLCKPCTVNSPRYFMFTMGLWVLSDKVNGWAICLKSILKETCPCILYSVC